MVAADTTATTAAAMVMVALRASTHAAMVNMAADATCTENTVTTVAEMIVAMATKMASALAMVTILEVTASQRQILHGDGHGRKLGIDAMACSCACGMASAPLLPGLPPNASTHWYTCHSSMPCSMTVSSWHTSMHGLTVIFAGGTSSTTIVPSMPDRLRWLHICARELYMSVQRGHSRALLCPLSTAGHTFTRLRSGRSLRTR